MTEEPKIPPGEDADTGATSLEARLRRLEEIIRSLDSDDMELEKALALFEEGVSHVRGAEQLLEHAELRVEELLGTDGDLETHRVDPGSE